MNQIIVDKIQQSYAGFIKDVKCESSFQFGPEVRVKVVNNKIGSLLR